MTNNNKPSRRLYVPSLYPDNPKTAEFKRRSEESMRRILDRHKRVS